MTPDATIVIVTKNRKDELRTAVRSAIRQTGNVETLVIDDGSSDGTFAMLRSEFPSVRAIRSEQSLGLIVQRNRAAMKAASPYIISIDDDGEFKSTETVAQTLKEFEHPRIGAVAIPYVNIRFDDAVLQRAPDDKDIYVIDTYVGTAHALRRDVFLRLNGYRDMLFHQGEERDYCARMLDHGYITRLGRADPLYHYTSPIRDLRRIQFYSIRNSILFAWHNVPMPHFVIHYTATILNGLRHGVKDRNVGLAVRAVFRGTWDSIRTIRHRKPVGSRTYRLGRRLLKKGYMTLNDVERCIGFKETPE